MQKSGVIINPAAGRGNGKGESLAKGLHGKAGVHVKLLRKFEDLQPAMAELADARITDLFISSGDGTIQAILSLLAETKLFVARPRLCILPHGTTNLTAIDIGFKRRRIADQIAFILNPQSKTIKRRATLRVINPRGSGPRHGFSFGAGAAARATRLTQTDFNDQGRKGQLAALRMMTGALAKSLLTKPHPNDKKRIDRPYPMEISMDGNLLCSGDQLMFIATTLEKQFFNARPFWGGKSGALRASAFAYPPPNVVRWLLPIMYGGENRKMPNGSVSKSGQGFSITCAEPYVMDGEFIDGPLEGPLLVEVGPEFEFISA